MFKQHTVHFVTKALKLNNLHVYAKCALVLCWQTNEDYWVQELRSNIVHLLYWFFLPIFKKKKCIPVKGISYTAPITAKGISYTAPITALQTNICPKAIFWPEPFQHSCWASGMVSMQTRTRLVLEVTLVPPTVARYFA